jgi:hypothetical protein
MSRNEENGQMKKTEAELFHLLIPSPTKRNPHREAWVAFIARDGVAYLAGHQSRVANKSLKQLSASELDKLNEKAAGYAVRMAARPAWARD